VLSCIAVANWFIQASLKEGKSINAIKLQRLVYFAHCWCLAVYGVPLTKEHVEAWKYGPVFPDIYHAAIFCGSGPIETLLKPDVISSASVAEEVNPLLEKIWSIYGGYTDVQLCNTANREDGPWWQTLQKNPNRKNTQIDEKDIIRIFSGWKVSGKSES
jgi:uncharacterized phage-associated protein